MLPMCYIKDVIARQELLFVEDQLWINTLKRQDQKNMYQSFNVSDEIEKKVFEEIVKKMSEKSDENKNN